MKPSRGLALTDVNLYNDCQAPAQALRGGASVPGFEAWQTVYLYKLAVGEDLHGTFHLPHSYVPGTSVIPHVHWALDNTAGVGGGTDAVQWEMTYTIAAGAGGAVIAAPGAAIVKETAIGTAAAYTGFYSEFPAIALANQIESTSIIFRLKRIAVSGGGATEYGDDACLIEFDLHYLGNKMGTEQATPPFSWT